MGLRPRLRRRRPRRQQALLTVTPSAGADTDHRQIFAFSGIVHRRPDDQPNSALTEFALGLVGPRDRALRVCYLPTAAADSPDAVETKRRQFADLRPDVEFSALTLFPQPRPRGLRDHLLAQDLVLVEGGNVVNLMALWRAHGLDTILRECWESGVVLAGPSAGSLCWHVGGPTDSFGDDLSAFTDGLALVPFSTSVHHDLADQPRREVYERLVGSGVLPAGYTTDDGVGLHYRGRELARAVTIRPGASASRCDPDTLGGVRLVRVDTELIRP